MKKKYIVLDPVNWREIRNVLLSFMASPLLNCSTTEISPPIPIFHREELSQTEISLKPVRHPLLPTKKRRPPVKFRPKPIYDTPITRDEYGGYGWQQNGWGVQSQDGWGASQEAQVWGAQEGWGWGDQNNKKSKNF